MEVTSVAMRIEEHIKGIRESIRLIEYSIEKGLVDNQRTIGFNTSAAAVDMLEMLLHKKSLIDPGFIIKHDWFLSKNKVQEKIVFCFSKKSEIIELSMKKYDLISYAADFASFLIKSINIDNIKEIILFGSASRMEADKDSDIDIFINVAKKDTKLEKNVKEAKEQFFGSSKYKNYWKLLGVTNNINIIVGLLEDWELENSIASTGITLYGKYQRKPLKGKDAVLLVWENVKPDSTRVLLNKNMFGY